MSRLLHSSPNSSYFEFKACKRGLCNAHHLRQLNYMEEITTYARSQRFSEFLLKTKDAVASVKSLNAKFKRKVDRQYDTLLKDAYLEMGAPDEWKEWKEWKEEKWVRGRRKKHRKQVKRDPERLLLNRLRDHRTAVLAFSKNKNVPFTNNGSEQDIRIVKVKQKISGGFREKAGPVPAKNNPHKALQRCRFLGADIFGCHFSFL